MGIQYYDKRGGSKTPSANVTEVNPRRLVKMTRTDGQPAGIPEDRRHEMLDRGFKDGFPKMNKDGTILKKESA